MSNKERVPVPVWLGEIVKRHIERLKLLRLEGEPLAEAMGKVTRIWGETLAEYQRWDPARDTPRLHRGFATLAATSERWPAPAHLLTALPVIPPQTSLPPPLPEMSEAKRRANLRRMAALFGSLKKQSPPRRQPRPNTHAPALTAAEEEALLAELKQYQASKKKASDDQGADEGADPAPDPPRT